MKVTNHQENSKNFKLIIGLTYALAASLCMLEYGRPLIDRYLWSGEVGEKIDYIESPVRITLPKPPELQSPDLPVPSKSESFTIVPNETLIKQPKALLVEMPPEIDFEIAPDTVATPKITTPPLHGFQLDRQPDCTKLLSHLREKIRYPKMMRDISSNGKVYMEVVINPDGNLNKESYKILRSAHPTFTKEVVRVLNTAPACTPGYKFGKPVPVIMQVPVNFDFKD
jgi:outer membrane biosynthesis protein TonB